MAMPMLLMARWRSRCCRRRGNGDADAANGDGVAMAMPMPGHINARARHALTERIKDGAALDQLTGQLKSASGSIRLLEEQLVSKYRGLDARRCLSVAIPLIQCKRSTTRLKQGDYSMMGR
jgi:hypothetical protein